MSFGLVESTPTIGGVAAIKGSEEAAIRRRWDRTAKHFLPNSITPTSIVADSQGNLYVADQNNHRVRKITPDGQVSTFAGDGTTSSINGPRGMAVDLADNIYVAASGAKQVYKITPEGIVSVLAGSGSNAATDGSATTLRIQCSLRH